MADNPDVPNTQKAFVPLGKLPPHLHAPNLTLIALGGKQSHPL